MNTAALLIFGKIIAWILMISYAVILVAGIYAVYRSNKNTNRVGIGLSIPKVFLFVFLILAPMTFLVGTCGI